MRGEVKSQLFLVSQEVSQGINKTALKSIIAIDKMLSIPFFWCLDDESSSVQLYLDSSNFFFYLRTFSSIMPIVLMEFMWF